MKHAKVQHSPKSLIALVMAIVLLVAAIPFVAVADDVNYYTATSVTNFGINKSQVSNAPTLATNNALTPTISSSWGNLKWTEADVTGNSNYIYFTFGAVTPVDGSSFMFYLKMPENADATHIALQFRNSQNSADNVWLGSGKPVYLMPATTREWESPVTATRGTDMKNETRWGFNVPADFEGWVRIPYSSINYSQEASHAMNRINVYFSSLNIVNNATTGTYVDEGVSFGACMVLGTATADYQKVLIDGATEAVDLFPNGEFQGTLLQQQALYPKKLQAEDSEEVSESGVVFNKQGGTAPNRTIVDKYHFYYPGTADKTEYVNAKGSYALTDLAHLQVNIQNAPATLNLTTDSLVFYASTDATVNTRFGMRLNNAFLSCGTDYKGLSYYLMDDRGRANWKEYKTVARSDENTTASSTSTTKTYYGDIELPAGFRGWVRIPVSAFRTTHGKNNSLAAYGALYLVPHTLGGQYGTLTLASFVAVQQDASMLHTLKFTGKNGVQQVMNLSGKFIDTPAGISMDQMYFRGNETYVNAEGVLNSALKVTVDDITAFAGCKLYYQYTQNGETVKTLLRRAGSTYYGTAAEQDEENVTEFYIDSLHGTDGAIVAGETEENVSVLGTSLWYTDGESIYTEGETQYFKLSFVGRALRTVVNAGVEYDLKQVRLEVAVKGTNNFTPYAIDTLADRCDLYVDFNKVLRGKATDAGMAREYDIKVVGVYKAEGADDLEVPSDILTGKSYNTINNLENPQ